MTFFSISELFSHVHPMFVENKRYFKALDQFLPMEEYEFVVLDTELTGLHERQDEIVSIGAVRIKRLQIMVGETFYAQVKPVKPLPKNSTLIHRLTPQQLKDAPPLGEVLPSFINYCGKALLVGHFVDLDLAFLNRACKRLFGSPLHNPCVDTLRLAQIHMESFGSPYRNKIDDGHSYSLSELSRQYGLPAFAPHDALQDAMQTAYLFLFLIKKFQGEGYRTLREIFRAGQGARWAL
ncbi:MAG: 3'-5' exonuclease [Desulfurivibrionaceae bacterium]